MRSRITVIVIAAAVLSGAYAAVPDTGFDGTCLVSNADEWGPTYEPGECDAGTTITRAANTAWTCSTPLSTLGPMPIRMIIPSTTVWSGAHVARLQTGCTGDGNDDTIDLMIEANGNGSTQGIAGDVLKFAPFGAQGPSELQLTINGDCGDPGGHFDFFQNQAEISDGSLVAIVNGTSGDYDEEEPTCQAAGGMLFWSETGNIYVLGGEYIGCNHALNGNAAKSGSGSTVIDAKFRVGKPGGCPGVVTTNACINTQGMTLTNVTSQRWNGSAYVTDPCTP